MNPTGYRTDPSTLALMLSISSASRLNKAADAARYQLFARNTWSPNTESLEASAESLGSALCFTAWSAMRRGSSSSSSGGRRSQDAELLLSALDAIDESDATILRMSQCYPRQATPPRPTFSHGAAASEGMSFRSAPSLSEPQTVLRKADAIQNKASESNHREAQPSNDNAGEPTTADIEIPARQRCTGRKGSAGKTLSASPDGLLEPRDGSIPKPSCRPAASGQWWNPFTGNTEPPMPAALAEGE